MFRKLRIWHKLALMVVPLALVAGLLGGLVVGDDHAQVVAARRELSGARSLQAVAAVLGPLARHANFAALAIGGDAAAAGPLRTASGEVDSALGALSQQEVLSTSSDLRARMEAIRTGWTALRDGALGVSMLESEARHRSLALSVVALGQQVAEQSGLTRTASEGARRVAQASLVWMPRVVMTLATVRARGAAIVARGGALADDVLVIASLMEGVREAQREADNLLRTAFDDSPRVRIALLGLNNRARLSTSGYDDMVRRLRAAVVDVTHADHTRLSTLAIDDQFVLLEAAQRTLADLITQQQGTAERRRNLVLGATLAGLVIAMLVSWWVSGDVRRQVAAVRHALGAVEQGRLEARAEVLTQDELGELAASLNAMFDHTLSLIQSREQRDQMQASIVKLLEEVSGVGEGDLTREAEVTADATGAIADSFNLMIAQLRQIIGDVTRTSVFVSESSTAIQGNAARLAAASERQSSQIADISSAVADMVASVHRVSDDAATSAMVADQARATASRGAQIVHGTRQGMEGIRQHVQETSKRIKRLGEKAQEIGEIVQLIGDIADRTSILALNASIQAAAAGDAGRGFAVVAEEVERLADRAADATKRIATLVRTTQNETAGTLVAMEDVTREVVAGSSLASEAAEALVEIERVSNTLAELIVSISAAARTQASGADVVARSMQSVSAIAQQTAPAARSAAESVSQLAGRANALRVSVLRFKLPAEEPGAEDAA